MNICAYVEQQLLGIGHQPLDLNYGQVCLRAVIMFFATLTMVRLGGKRFLSHNTAFDAVLGFMMASMLARACNGSSPFWQTIVAGFLIVALHRIVAKVALHSHSFGNLVKGHATLVIKDGAVLSDVLRRHDLSEHDLAEDLRMNGNAARPEDVKEAYFERNGHISVIKKQT